MGTAILVAVLLVAGVVGFLVVGVGLSFLPIWVQARASGVPVSFVQMLGMKLRGLDPKRLYEVLITAHKAGLDLNMDDLEAHVLAGGHLEAAVSAVISAEKAGLGVGFDRMCAIDLAGRDVEQAVEAAVNPRVLSCPAPGLPQISGVARDGIRVGAKVRVTVRANLEKLVGGAGEQTILARVGEGIVGAIGKMTSHSEAQERPELISQYILSHGLDSGTAFEIVSVDVADIDILDNVNARLREVQAQTDKVVAQARAEMRRMMAVARQQEMKARVVEMTAQLTANQALLPLAEAGACRNGQIWRSPRAVRAVWGRHRWDAAGG